MATLQTALTYARAQVQTDTNGLTDTNGIIFANEALFDFRRKLISNGVDAGGVQEAYRDATAGVGTYLYPTSPQMMFLKAIELNYANNDPTGYRTASQVDASNLPGGVSFSLLRSNGDPTNPNFDDRGDYYEIFPTPTAANNLTNAIRLLYYPVPTEFTATSDTISYPESLDYRILGLRIAANYTSSLGNALISEDLNNQYDARVKEFTSMLARGSQQPITATPIQLTGYEF